MNYLAGMLFGFAILGTILFAKLAETSSVKQPPRYAMTWNECNAKDGVLIWNPHGLVECFNRATGSRIILDNEIIVKDWE